MPGGGRVPAAAWDLAIVQGVDFSESYTWTSEAGRMGFDGWTPQAQIRSHPGGRLLMDLTPGLTIEDGIEDSNGTTGEAIRLYLSGEQTAALRSGGVWDLLLVDGPTRLKLFTGGVRVTRTATVVADA